MNVLEQLRTQTRVVADSGDFESIKKFQPTDSTTNPSLILHAAQDPTYSMLLDDAVHFATSKSSVKERQLALAMNKLAVDFGIEILKIVPGRVSTETDARLSFDTEGIIEKSRELISLYNIAGIDNRRVLIKIASTWEGINAARILEREGIRCNMTLLFSLPQAIASAEAGATLISPFVGRVLDWHKKAQGIENIAPAEDPGVLLVKNIYNYLKNHGYNTEIMGASFRNTGEIIELAGCDLLTIAPTLLHELEQMEAPLEKKLSAEKSKSMTIPSVDITEKKFRWMLNEDAMATEKLAEGIRKFTEDLIKLEKIIMSKL